MRKFFLLLMLGTATLIPVRAQVAPKDWTPWESVQGDWAEFYAIVAFDGDKTSKSEVAKIPLKKLKVNVYLAGRFSPPLPLGVDGVKQFKILYSEFGKYETIEGFRVDFAELNYKGWAVQTKNESITRPAEQFDVDELDKPALQTMVQHGFANEPFFKTRKGRIYKLKLEWRRKGDLVEIKLKDYRP